MITQKLRAKFTETCWRSRACYMYSCLHVSMCSTCDPSDPPVSCGCFSLSCLSPCDVWSPRSLRHSEVLSCLPPWPPAHTNLHTELNLHTHTRMILTFYRAADKCARHSMCTHFAKSLLFVLPLTLVQKCMYTVGMMNDAASVQTNSSLELNFLPADNTGIIIDCLLVWLFSGSWLIPDLFSMWNRKWVYL